MPTVMTITLNGSTAAPSSTLMTRGSYQSNNGYSENPVGILGPQPIGNLDDKLFYESSNCQEIYTNSGGNLVVKFTGVSLGQDWFTSIELSIGTFLTSTATYVPFGGYTQWTWIGVSALATSGTETVVINP